MPKVAKSPGILDSLPYVDEAIPDSYEDYAMSLIQEEMSKGQPAPVQQLPPSRFSNDTASLETTTKLKAPSSDNIDEWKEAVQRAKIAYEQERLQSIRLQVAKETDTALYKAQVTAIEDTRQGLERANTTVQERVQQVNYSRQQEQQAAGEEIRALEQEYQDRLAKIIALTAAVKELEDQVGNY